MKYQSNINGFCWNVCLAGLHGQLIYHSLGLTNLVASDVEGKLSYWAKAGCEGLELYGRGVANAE